VKAPAWAGVVAGCVIMGTALACGAGLVTADERIAAAGCSPPSGEPMAYGSKYSYCLPE
jgi:hypothetical protein